MALKHRARRWPAAATRVAWAGAFMLSLVPVAASAQPAPQPTAGEAQEEDYPPLLESSTFLLAMAGMLGDAPSEPFDTVLRSRGYADAPRVWGGEMTAEWKVLDWLWLGGRVDLRTRDWGRRGDVTASAFGLGGLALVEPRFTVNRSIDLGATVGAGLGLVGFDMNNAAEVYFAPKLHFGALVGFTLMEPVRLMFRVAWDYMRASNFNGFGHDLNLGGASLALGLEVRQ